MRSWITNIRNFLTAEDGPTRGDVPPLLKQILQEYSATGLPPAYLPKTPPSQTGEA